MSAEPDEALCGLISELSIDQFKRCMDDNCFADEVLDHVARCSDHVDLKAKEKFNMLLENLIAREGVTFSKESQWKHAILSAQTLHMLWANGIPTP
jgi:hypothetical protein